MSTAAVETAPGRSLTGKYLTFLGGQESFGIAVLTIREIIRMVDITSVPQIPPHVGPLSTFPAAQPARAPAAGPKPAAADPLPCPQSCCGG